MKNLHIAKWRVDPEDTPGIIKNGKYWNSSLRFHYAIPPLNH